MSFCIQACYGIPCKHARLLDPHAPQNKQNTGETVILLVKRIKRHLHQFFDWLPKKKIIKQSTWLSVIVITITNIGFYHHVLFITTIIIGLIKGSSVVPDRENFPIGSEGAFREERDQWVEKIGYLVSKVCFWIGLRENLQETMVFTIKYRAFL